MKIATWNVNSIRSRENQVKKWLVNHDIDVLCLQETKVIDDDFPVKVFQDLGYYTCVSGQKSYNGVAIFSRQEMDDINSGFSHLLSSAKCQDFDSQKRIITALINNIRIVNVYVPNGSAIASDKYVYKLEWLKILKNYLSILIEEKKEDILLCGDFNIALEDRDIYNPKGKKNQIMASEEERQYLRDILSLGFTDIFRQFNNNDGCYTWWDYRQGGFSKNRGWRIDHIYVTKNLTNQVNNCYIDINPRKEEKPSDHTPVICQF